MSKSIIEWHKIKTRPLTEKEKEYYENNYEFVPEFIFDCEMPDDNQEILIATKYGTGIDTCYYDIEGSHLDCRGDWEDVLAWAELPKYEEGESE